MKFIYSILMFLAEVLLPLVSRVNPKIRSWYLAQKSFKTSFTAPIDSSATYIWIHCASSGEFEQALPLIHALKSRRKELRFAVSFFSVSGYDLNRNSYLADTFFLFPVRYKKKHCDIDSIATTERCNFYSRRTLAKYASCFKGTKYPGFFSECEKCHVGLCFS